MSQASERLIRFADLIEYGAETLARMVEVDGIDGRIDDVVGLFLALGRIAARIHQIESAPDEVSGRS